MRVRAASADDAAAIAAIYAPYVTGTRGLVRDGSSPDAAEMARRMAAGDGRYPWLVGR